MQNYGMLLVPNWTEQSGKRKNRICFPSFTTSLATFNELRGKTSRILETRDFGSNSIVDVARASGIAATCRCGKESGTDSRIMSGEEKSSLDAFPFRKPHVRYVQVLRHEDCTSTKEGRTPQPMCPQPNLPKPKHHRIKTIPSFPLHTSQHYHCQPPSISPLLSTPITLLPLLLPAPYNISINLPFCLSLTPPR
jgi:hypothetical protein